MGPESNVTDLDLLADRPTTGTWPPASPRNDKKAPRQQGGVKPISTCMDPKSM